ncbi:MAG: TRAP transporter small permease subunit [Xanthobacteraceae bacterium]
MTTGLNARAILAPLLRAHDAVTTFAFELSKLCLVVIVFSFSYEVVARYFFAAPVWWANEVVSYALCVGVFLAMPEVTRRHGHVAVTVIPELLPPRYRNILLSCIQFVGFLACAAVAWMSLNQNISQYVREALIIAAVRPIPKVYISAWITFGFLSSALYFLRNLDWRVPAPSDGERDIRL